MRSHDELSVTDGAHMREFDDSRVRLPVRSRIIDRLVEETGGATGNRRLTVVCAPSGYGKTRTVLHWLGDGSDPTSGVHWISCAPMSTPEETERSFWNVVAQSLGVAARGETAMPDPSADGEDPEAWAERFIAELTAPVTLIIDNYHVITSAATDIAIAHLAGASPLLTLVVIARRVALLDRPLVSAKTRVRLIGPDDLALTEAEAPELAGSYGIPVSPELLSALKRADGWPLAIRAALNLGSDQLYLGDPETRQWNTTDRAARAFNPIANLDTFALDSLEIIGLHARQVILAAAVLDAIDLHQIEQTFSLTPNEALSATQELIEAGLLTEIREVTPSEYRCHKSVRQALREHAVTSVDTAQLHELYRTRAAAIEPSAPFTAFRLFCAAEEYTAAEILLARNFTTITDEVQVTAQILRVLPEAVLTAHPTFVAALIMLETPRTDVAPSTLAYLATLWEQGLTSQLPDLSQAAASPIYLPLVCQAMVAARLSGQIDHASTLMQHLESRLAASIEDDAVKPADDNGVRAVIALSGSLPNYYHEAASTALMAGDFAQARRNLERLRHHSERMIARPWSGFGHASTRTVTDAESGSRWLLVALGELAFAEMIDGNMRRCAELIAEMDSRAAASSTAPPGIAWVGSAIARAHLSYELGDDSLLHRAVTDLTPIVDRMEGWQMLLIAEAAVMRASHGSAWALAHLEAGLANRSETSQPYNKWSEFLRCYHATLLSSTGNLAGAAQVLDSCDASSTRVRLERARLALFSSNDVDALLAAQQIGDPVTTLRQQLDRSLIIAVAAWGCGRQNEAIHSLSRAAEQLERHGTPSALCNVPHDMLREVAVAAQLAGACDIVALVDAIPQPAQSRRYERLTEMELRTLAAIAEHRNANQAAAALFITPGTVKKHLASVYRKLRAGGRDEAILQASRMGLLRAAAGAEGAEV